MHVLLEQDIENMRNQHQYLCLMWVFTADAGLVWTVYDLPVYSFR